MAKMKKKNGGMKEFFRKKIVTLKRKPQMIPLVVLAIAFLVYSLNLTQVSNTTAKIQLSGMGLSGYPHRKKTNIPMLVLMFLMLAVLIVCDTFYMGRITTAITRPEHPIMVDKNTIYITKAYDMLGVHRIIVAIGAGLTLLVPVLRKLLRKIDTSLPVEEGMEMDEIMLTGDN